MSNPYSNLESSAFWKTGVAAFNPMEISGLWKPKFKINTDDLVTTAGSCFAQHLSRAMVDRGFNWLDSELLPSGFSNNFGRSYGYGVFSFRTGNIYTVKLLRQWVDAAYGLKSIDNEVWEKCGRYFDPLRPAIEPGGFNSAKECLVLREYSLKKIREVLSKTTLFVFTLGLTESWINLKTGITYAACPGTLAGKFDEEIHAFHNQMYPEIIKDLSSVFDVIRKHNPDVRFLLTVSPVPLVATASSLHVLPATIYSKSVLRAVAGDLAMSNDDVDYFPSFEIISSFPYRGFFYESNMREVSQVGVDVVMKSFFAGIDGLGFTKNSKNNSGACKLPIHQESVVDEDKFSIECEEALLEAFSK